MVDISLGAGFVGTPGYIDNDGRPFDPLEKEECPNCGNSVKKNEWMPATHFVLWD